MIFGESGAKHQRLFINEAIAKTHKKKKNLGRKMWTSFITLNKRVPPT